MASELKLALGRARETLLADAAGVAALAVILLGGLWLPAI